MFNISPHVSLYKVLPRSPSMNLLGLEMICQYLVAGKRRYRPMGPECCYSRLISVVCPEFPLALETQGRGTDQCAASLLS